MIGTGLYIDDLHQQVWDEAKTGLLLASLALAGIACGAILFTRALSRKLMALNALIAGIAEGDLDVPPAGPEDPTELGAIARAVEALRQDAKKQKALQGQVNEAQERERARGRRFQACIQEFEKNIAVAVGALGEQVGNLKGSAESLSEAAEVSTYEAANAVSVSASAADNSHAVSAATSSSAARSRRSPASTPHQRGGRGGHPGSEPDQSRRCEACQRRRGERLDCGGHPQHRRPDQPSGAERDNRSPRAGEFGRGFAVVAAEVKELSAQTAKATDAIADQIHAIQSSTGEAVSAIHSVSGKVAEIQTFTGAIAAAVEEQTAAAQEIASNVALAAGASEKASASSNEVSKTATQTKQLAVSVSNVSRSRERFGAISKATGDLKSAVAAAL